MLFCDIVLLTEILGEVIQTDTPKFALFEFRDPRFLEVIQSTMLIPQAIGLKIGEFSVEHAGAKIHSTQLFLKIIAKDFFDLLHESIGGFEVDWRLRCARSEKRVVTYSHDHVCLSHPKQWLMPVKRTGAS